MVDLIQKGAIWHESKRKAHRTVAVTVRRGGLEFTALATKGFYSSVAESTDGMIINERAEDYIIAVVNYDFANGKGPVEPEVGDFIYDSSSGSEVRMEVLPLAVEPAKRYSDSYRISWRIHTKETGNV
ncbi:MAG: hypothetical protein ABGX16_21075 [Pirellulales bacterium]